MQTGEILIYETTKGEPTINVTFSKPDPVADSKADG